MGGPKYDHRKPANTVSRGVSLKSSLMNASLCHARTSGVMSRDGWVKVATLPSRKFAHSCWNVVLPLGSPLLVKVNVPYPVWAFSVFW